MLFGGWLIYSIKSDLKKGATVVDRFGNEEGKGSVFFWLGLFGRFIFGLVLMAVGVVFFIQSVGIDLLENGS